MLMSNSGFEDVAYESNLCSSGSMLGVMAGSHHNRAWIVHSSNLFSHTLENFKCLVRGTSFVFYSVYSFLVCSSTAWCCHNYSFAYI